MMINDNRLFVGDKALNCRVDSIDSDGEMTVVGYMPDTQYLLKVGTLFSVKNVEGKLMVEGIVIKVLFTEVCNVTRFSPDEQEASELIARLLCDIKCCKFFESLDYTGGVSERKMP